MLHYKKKAIKAKMDFGIYNRKEANGMKKIMALTLIIMSTHIAFAGEIIQPAKNMPILNQRQNAFPSIGGLCPIPKSASLLIPGSMMIQQPMTCKTNST
jgi:hypothetical protein